MLFRFLFCFVLHICHFSGHLMLLQGHRCYCRWSEKECDICEKPLALDVPSAIVKATDLNLTHQRLCAIVMYSNNFNMT